LWTQSAHAKLLHQPPASRISAKQEALIDQSIEYTQTLERALAKATSLCEQLVQQGSEQHRHEFVETVLVPKPVVTLVRLLVWLQQCPELLQLHIAASEEGSSDNNSSRASHNYGDLWLVSAVGEARQLFQMKVDRVSVFQQPFS
jgi:hypothetical protein